jgi:SAM-dependent methyltransferase
VSGFSAVDRSPDPGRLVAFLDFVAAAESGIKHYMAATHALRRPRAPILDVGCGAGHDLSLLASLGLRAVGVEPSEVMVSNAKSHTGRSGVSLVRGVGEALPFPDGVFAGARIDRVLMHVEHPQVLLGEALRCVGTDGLLTVFEPDWGRLQVESTVLPSNVSWMANARHPAVGGQLWQLVEDAGGEVLDRVEELSVWRSLRVLEVVARFPDSVERAVAAGYLTAKQGRSWVMEQQARDAAGIFRATMPKVLVVASKR